jgi:hypothetical protein
MKEQEDQQPNNQPSPIEDLAVKDDAAEEVKGGPIEYRELTIKVRV